jgi:hypothetical protein
MRTQLMGLSEGGRKPSSVVLHNGPPGVPLVEVARILGVKRPYLYGILLVAKLKPTKGIGKKGKSAMLLPRAEIARLKKLMA